MAVCKYLGCRETIVRIEGSEAWIGEDEAGCEGHESLRGDLHGASFYCNGSCRSGKDQCGGSGAIDGRHMPAEPIIIEPHPGDAEGDFNWCNEDLDAPAHFGAWLIDGRFTACDAHLASAVAQTHALVYAA